MPQHEVQCSGDHRRWTRERASSRQKTFPRGNSATQLCSKKKGEEGINRPPTPRSPFDPATKEWIRWVNATQFFVKINGKWTQVHAFASDTPQGNKLMRQDYPRLKKIYVCGEITVLKKYPDGSQEQCQYVPDKGNNWAIYAEQSQEVQQIL